MEILITGGAGFIGSHISRLLLDDEYSVTIYDNLLNGFKELVDPRSNFVQGDLSDQALLEKILPGFEAVIHMASLAEVNQSVKDPMLYAQNNILGSVSLLEAMRKSGVKKIIFSSSCTVYGFPEKLPITEDTPVLAVNPYGATKVAVENLLKSYNFLHGFDVTLLRYFNPYGPNEMHKVETHAVPNFIISALKKQPIPLYWKGEQIRDFIYVEDLARAHIAVLGLTGWNVFNVGTEKGIKVIDVLKTIEGILGEKLEINDLGERSGDVMATFASSQKLMQTTGWKSQMELKEGLEKTISYFKARLQTL